MYVSFVPPSRSNAPRTSTSSSRCGRFRLKNSMFLPTLSPPPPLPSPPPNLPPQEPLQALHLLLVQEGPGHFLEALVDVEQPIRQLVVPVHRVPARPLEQRVLLPPALGLFLRGIAIGLAASARRAAVAAGPSPTARSSRSKRLLASSSSARKCCPGW